MLNNKVIFDFKIRFENIKNENDTLNISSLDLDELKGIANGMIFVFFEPQREYMILETGIIDYLIQFRTVIEEIENGNDRPFSVSCDWYNNSLDYRYSRDGKLEIYEVNGNEFKISVSYLKFKFGFEKFEKRTFKELTFLYPKLKENKRFLKLVNGITPQKPTD